MLHKISEMCDVVNLMYVKSMNLRRMKYDTPKDLQNKTEIDTLIADIQQLALQIAHDRSPYDKK